MISFDKIVSIIAPHHCMVCGFEDAVVCAWCLPDIVSPLPSRCYKCKRADINSKVCAPCRAKSKLGHVWASTEYDTLAKQLIHDFKFERKQAAAEPIARLMKEALPYLSKVTVVVHIPTATKRVRMRGYDHAELIANELARLLGLKQRTALRRITQTRQVGAHREARLAQMEHAFELHQRTSVNVPVLLVDDLVTTGATLESAARLLRGAGAKKVDAVVFAQK